VWGWQTQLFALALILAIMLEASHALRWRWQLRDKDINRIVDLCTVVLGIWGVYSIVAQGAVHAIFLVLKWLPVIVFPLVAIQHYSDRDGLPLSALSMQQRKWGRNPRTIEIGYPYLVVCLIAASIGNQTPEYFFLATLVLWLWALWPRRSRRFPVGVWLSLMILASGSGYLTHIGILSFQGYLERQIPEWLTDWFDTDTDPYRRMTALGTIGRLKLSDTIVLRVSTPDNKPVPGLLRIASYNVLAGDTWFARAGGFVPLDREDGLNWRIRDPDIVGNTLEISQTLDRDAGMLPLPLGAYWLGNIPAETVQQNPLGSIKVLQAPEYLRYSVDYHPTEEEDLPLTTQDTWVPELYQDTLAEINTTLALNDHSVQKVPAILKRYFDSQFTYSLDLEAINTQLPPLVDFLRNTRSGHCEYFASATVLLLRQAGIPARYASGFSVQEYSDLEQRYVIRKRHAHAWALAYINGHWQNVDTTPAVWVRADAEHASPFIGLYDALSWLWLQFKHWQLNQAESTNNNALAWWLLPLGLILAWRLRRQSWIRRGKRQPIQSKQVVNGPGSDSDCYRIMNWYLQQGLERRPAEPLASWLERVIRDDSHRHTSLTEILRLHYRYRFDPAGLDAGEREYLRTLVQNWFTRY
jgi:hypothetical protein